MDHEEVVRVITSHCKKYECWRYIKNNFIKRSLSANIPRTPFSLVPSRSILGSAEGKFKVFGLQHQPLDFNSQRIRSSEFDPCPSSFRNPDAEFNMLPMVRPLNSFLPHTESFAGFQEENSVSNNQNHHFNGYPSSSNVNSVYMKENHSISEISRSKNQFLQALGLSRKPVKVNINYKLAHKVDKLLVKDYDSMGKRTSLKRSCKKIRNIIEFKRLLKSAENNPKSFPAILMNQKTKFLGSLSLAPRQICSRKMLSKFKEEMRKKKVIKRRSWYMGHKVLRDRNKILKKMSHHKKPENLPYLKTPKNTSTCNFITPLDNIKYKRMFEKDNKGFCTKNETKVLGLQSNEAKYFPVELKGIDHTDKGLKALLIENNQRKDNNEIFPLRNQVYLNKSLAKSCGSSIQGLSNRYWQGINRNTAQEPSTSQEEQSKNVQKRMDLEDISELKLSNVNLNGSSLKTYSTSSNNLTTPQPQFPFIQPVSMPTMPVTPNTGLPTNLPLIVRPMIKAQTLTMNETSQNGANNSFVWGYLVNGKVNILNQKDNFKSETYLQPKPLPKNTREFIGSKLGKNGTNAVLIQPYRVLEPKIKVSSGIETQNITTGKSFTCNNLQRNGDFGILGNAIENSFASSTPDDNISVSIPKDVDVKMRKLKKWIQRMMLNIVPCICTFEKDIEILKRDLLAELNYGINLVKEIRKAVKEAERM